MNWVHPYNENVSNRYKAMKSKNKVLSYVTPQRTSIGQIAN